MRMLLCEESKSAHTPANYSIFPCRRDPTNHHQSCLGFPTSGNDLPFLRSALTSSTNTSFHAPGPKPQTPCYFRPRFISLPPLASNYGCALPACLAAMPLLLLWYLLTGASMPDIVTRE